MFRIRIIENRSKKHMKDGIERYKEYMANLKKNPRLAELLIK
jgi:hypothetical protein